MAYDIFSLLRERVLAALRHAVPDLPDDIAARVEVTLPREAAHGDAATNAALVAAKPARRNPRDLAAALAAALPDDMVAAAEAAGPGFVNLRLHPPALHAQLPEILRTGEAYGDSALGAGLPVNVEYVSANPTGPMHVGHCRGAVVGDALANLLRKAGFAVTKEYYINDAGAQVVALAWAAYWRYLQALGTPLAEQDFAEEVPGGLQYRGDYLVAVGEALAERYGASLAGPGGTIAAPDLWLDTVRDFTVAAMLAGIREDLELARRATGCFHERAGAGRGRCHRCRHRAVARTGPDLRRRARAAQGQAAGGLGAAPADAVPRGAVRRRRRPSAAQIRRQQHVFCQRHRLPRRQVAARCGADDRHLGRRSRRLCRAHAGGGARARRAVGYRALPDRACDEGRPAAAHVQAQPAPTSPCATCSTKSGRDAVRFTMLTRKSDAQMEFDIDAAVAQTRDNPVFYVQYAHARCAQRAARSPRKCSAPRRPPMRRWPGWRSAASPTRPNLP